MEGTKKNSTNIFFRGFNYLSQIYIYIFVLIIDVRKVTLQLCKGLTIFGDRESTILSLEKNLLIFAAGLKSSLRRKVVLSPFALFLKTC